MEISRRADIIEEVAEIEKTGVLTMERPQGKATGNRIERGDYIPDDAHIEICLNCTRKKCTGYCKRVKGGTRKRG